MTQTTATPATQPQSRTDQHCNPADRVTKSLLGYGVIAGPAYVTVAVAQALTRDGFDLTRHPWSMLSNGDHGWIQIVNFLLTGLMVIAFAVGLRRALDGGVGARWAPRLVAAYGLSLIAAGAFRADPGLGFPIGTPAGPGPISWHGTLHFAAGGIGFSCLAAACFVLARRFAAEGRLRWARFSRVSAGAFLAGFAMVASGSGVPGAVVAFTAAIILIWGWMSVVAVDRYRIVAR
ncbi:MAG TPA: DUF998 domain-containing protein [Kineosporiaceae bacterium]|nr:DUF998 domain-containing protein [Kineosporiaceae bacterium]